MAKWIALLLALMATLISVTSAAALENNVSYDDAAGDLNVHTTVFEDPQYSAQILLLRAGIADFYWILFQGPSKEKVNPCPTYPKPFQGVSMSVYFDYNRDDINKPLSPPAMDLDMRDWDGRTNCKWITTGGDDVGMVVCDDYASSCSMDASYDDGVINCHGVSYHRVYVCEF